MVDAATAVAGNSTTVRTMKSVRFAALRATFGVLDRVAPGTSARLATRMWCSVPANGRRRDDRPLPGLHAPESTTSTVSVADGWRIVVEAWGEGPSVYLVHGWGGWRGQLGAFVEPLAARGHRVVAIDMPSHGDSGPGALGPGKSTLVEFATALRAVVDLHGRPAGIVAHSLGCAATAFAIAEGMPAPARLGFVAPTLEPVTYTRQMAQALGFSERTRLGLLRRLEKLVDRPMSDFELREISARGITTPPTLVAHDRGDRETPYREAELLAGAWPDVEVLPTDGLGHRRILRDTRVIDRVATFVTPQ